MARFRLAPPQACDNLFILDFIARRSVAQVHAAGKNGWALSFDPHFWEKFTRVVRLRSSRPRARRSRSSAARGLSSSTPRTPPISQA